LSYESIPVIFPGSLVIVIAPLVSIMKEQCSKLNKLEHLNDKFLELF
jgi:superfamily II DNA helicase RecQ